MHVVQFVEVVMQVEQGATHNWQLWLLLLKVEVGQLGTQLYWYCRPFPGKQVRQRRASKQVLQGFSHCKQRRFEG